MAGEVQKLKQLATQYESESWAEAGSCQPSHPLLKSVIASLTYSIGVIRDQEAKFITRAYPTLMTQLYFEFCGGLSEVRDNQGRFAFGGTGNQTNTIIHKRTYLKQGLGSWFDIYQLPSKLAKRPIKNLKVDLYPDAIYRLFNISPQELAREDLQLSDLFGVTNSSLMLEEMEAAETGKELVNILERNFLNHILRLKGNRKQVRLSGPQAPGLDDDLRTLSQFHGKSERWLQKYYSKVYGMSFKKMQGNLRFYQAHRELTRAAVERKPMNLTELAYRFDYFDQAHFIREFKRYTGMTPGKYARARLDAETQSLFYW